MLTRVALDLPNANDPEVKRLIEALVADRERVNKTGALDIEGGLVNNTPVGATAAATGDFTTLRGQRDVVAVATGSNRNVTTAEVRTLFTNEGATARQDFTLPTAVADLEYAFYCHDTDGIRVIAAAGDTIRIAGSVSLAAGRIDSTTIGSTVTLVAINATEWIALSSLGTWTVT